MGKSAALANIPGFTIAYVMHGSLSMLGVSAITDAHPSLIAGIQLVGAGYLFYLGAQLILAVASKRTKLSRGRQARPISRLFRKNATGSVSNHHACVLEPYSRHAQMTSVDISLDEAQAPTLRTYDHFRCFLDGFLTNALNPKITLFYLAAFPQFIQAGADSVRSSFSLVLIHIAISCAWFFFVAQMLEVMLGKAQDNYLVTVLNRVSGYALIALSIGFLFGAVHAMQ